MNQTPSSSRVHIAFFGRRNCGKSSLLNAVIGQDLSIVSDIKGTTTDPVLKSMELLPLGPVVIIDTPGFDDEGALGELRVKKVMRILDKTDIAVLALDGELPPEDAFSALEIEHIKLFHKKNIPFIIAHNKSDIFRDEKTLHSQYPAWMEKIKSSGVEIKDFDFSANILSVSAKTGDNINSLKEKLAMVAEKNETSRFLIADLIHKDDIIVLVIPIDSSAPKGRLILPQQQVIREILDAGAVAITCKDTELNNALSKLSVKPALVITDSQVFQKVSAIVPEEIPLTSFSILFARYNGFLENAIKGVTSIDALKDEDKILICEGCSHHRQCDDIGTVKLPAMIKNYTKKNLSFIFNSGGDFPHDLGAFRIVIHCGACMLNQRETLNRCHRAETQNVPFTNYGITIAHIQGILKRSVAMFNFNQEGKNE